MKAFNCPTVRLISEAANNPTAPTRRSKYFI
jgi:hypothetical protein